MGNSIQRKIKNVSTEQDKNISTIISGGMYRNNSGRSYLDSELG
jgi:hypothetical protein